MISSSVDKKVLLIDEELHSSNELFKEKQFGNLSYLFNWFGLHKYRCKIDLDKTRNLFGERCI